MDTGFSAGAVSRRRPQPLRSAAPDRRAERSSVDARTAAWLAVLPTAVVVTAAVALLGAPLADLLFPEPTARFWPGALGLVRPEPTEHAAFLIALTAPLLLSALTVAFARRVRLPARRAAQLAYGSELAAVLAVAGAAVAQRSQAPQNYTGDTTPVVYFTTPTVALALALGLALALAIRSPADRLHAGRLFAPGRARSLGAAAVAITLVVVTLLPALDTDSSISQAYEAVSFHHTFTYDEVMAVVDGRSPLRDFAAQYASLWPYALAAAMSVLGSSLAAFTGLMAALTGVVLLALYDVLRRVSRSALAGLLLFVPLLATCGFRLHGPEVNRFSLVNYFGVMPLRYAGPFLLAWLVTRHLDGRRPRRIWPLFAGAGLVALNNLDFGLAALGATVAALVWTRTGDARVTTRRSLLEAGAGLAGALAAVTLLLLVRTGGLPDVSLLTRYSRIFAVEGFAMLPIQPLFGFALAIFCTHVAAVGLATVRALQREPDRLLTGLLAWSGVFGLGAGSYYVGHSLSEVLIYTFPAWALSVTLLTVATFRALAHGTRRPRPAEIACLVAFGLLTCSLAQLPAPWRQIDRLRSDGPPVFAHPPGERFVVAHTERGEPVLIVARLGHRIAATHGLDDVEPFTGAKSIFTLEQLEVSVRALRAAGGTKLFLEPANAYGDLGAVLRERYALRGESEGLQLWEAR